MSDLVKLDKEYASLFNELKEKIASQVATPQGMKILQKASKVYSWGWTHSLSITLFLSQGEDMKSF
jgi:hypothetical protein